MKIKFYFKPMPDTQLVVYISLLTMKNTIKTCLLFLFLWCQGIIAGGDGRVMRWCWVNFQCQGVLLIWIIVGQGFTALAVGVGGVCLDIYSLVYHFSYLSSPLSGRRSDID